MKILAQLSIPPLQPSKSDRLLRGFLFGCLLMYLCAGSALAGSVQGGAAIVDITPKKWPLRLVGSFSERLADSVHDPLHARSIALSDGETTIVLTVVDNCLIRRDVLDAAKAIASEKTGIPTDHMMISATHTHTAPTTTASAGTEAEVEYRRQAIEGIAEAMIKAHGAMQSAQVGWGGDAVPDEVFNRRWFIKPSSMPLNPFGEKTDIVKMNPKRDSNLISPAGPTDPEVSVLSVRDARGKPLALLGNYPLHYVGGIPPNKVSADYFGEFCRLIGVRLRARNDRFVGILSNGTSGNINNINFFEGRPPREPFEQIRIVAAKVADAAYFADRKANYQSDLSIDMLEHVVPLKVRKPDADLVRRCQAYLEKEDDDKELPRLAKHYAKRVLNQMKEPDRIEMKVQVIRIGDLAICTLPFEVFAEIGLELKKQSPFADTFVIELANGAYGYLPTREQHVFGGYETWLTTNRVQLDASDILIEELEKMMAQLKK